MKIKDIKKQLHHGEIFRTSIVRKDGFVVHKGFNPVTYKWQNYLEVDGKLIPIAPIKNNE